MLHHDLKGSAGQALLELTVSLCLAVFMAAAAAGMIRYSLAAPWLDELLFLRLHLDSPPATEDFLGAVEREGQLPAYFASDDLGFSRLEHQPTAGPLPLHRTVGAGIRSDAATLQVRRDSGGLIPLSTTDSAYTGTVEIQLAMVPHRPMGNGQVRQAVGRIFLMGLSQGPFTAAARSLGLNLVHLSLDSLPKDAVNPERGGER